MSSRSRLVSVVVAGGAFLVLANACLRWRVDRQARNLRLAHDQVEDVRSELMGAGGFEGVSIRVYTGGGGGLAVVGFVESQLEFEALRDLMERCSPSVPVSFEFLRIGE